MLKTVGYFRSMLSLLALGCLLAGAAHAEPGHAEPVQVNVGGYNFPPFANKVSDGQWSGLTLDVLAAMNELQSDYEFIFFATSANRRFHDFERRHYDMMLFESPNWGWQGKPVVSLQGPVTGREVFIAKAAKGRGQDYFDERQGKRTALFSGYHYAFADYNPDRAHLRKEHGAVMTSSHESIIQMVLRERVELGVVTEGFMHEYLAQHPQYQGQLLIGEEADQLYQHALIMRRGSLPSIAYMSDLFAELDSRGELSRLLSLHGVPSAD